MSGNLLPNVHRSERSARLRRWAPSIAAERGAMPTRPESIVYDELFAWWVAPFYAERPPEVPARRPEVPELNA